ncbi:hypothetical protein [Candidatus Phytoplasma sp. AldY-WA1]|uniref:hypothetical protein n=1 Tax=Candidatus Phytoplasma sp. AldY-WA1 TaxID=2852100 RepID=UPI002550DEBB|nr:hypothetical protein [Candidatus Phytoplasma sp. AldY-WA1]
MENTRKQNILNFTFLSLIFIGVILTTCGIAFAISNYFKTETRHTVNVQNKFARLVVTEARIQDPSVDKFLIPTEIPMTAPTTDTYTVIKNFVGKLDSQGKKIEQDMFLKTIIKYENDEIGKFFSSQLKVNGTIYDDTKRVKIVADQDYQISVETQQTAIAGDNLTSIIVIVEYELVDKDGKSFEGTKEIIKSQIVKTT